MLHGRRNLKKMSSNAALPPSGLKCIGIVSDHDESVWSLAWHPVYPSLLVSCSSDKTVRVYFAKRKDDAVMVKCLDILENQHNRTIRRVGWSLPSGNALAMASFDGTSSIWILLKNKWNSLLNSLEDEYSKWVPTMETKKDSGSSTTRLLKCVSTLEGHENEVKSVAWNYSHLDKQNSKEMDQSDDSEASADCGLLATCGRDKTVWIWEAIDKVGFSDFDCNSVCSGHTQDVKFVAFHPLTRPDMPSLLFSASYDNTIRVWKEGGNEDVSQGDEWACIGILRGHTSTVWSLAFEPSQEGDVQQDYPQYMISVGDDKNVIVWREDVVGNYLDMNYTQIQTISDVHTRTIYYVDWCTYRDPNIRGGQLVSLVATVGGDNTLAVFEWNRDKRELTLLKKVTNAHDSDINCCVWNKHEFGLLATSSDDGIVKLWRFELGQ